VTISAENSDSLSNSSPNAAGIFIALLLGWIGTIWLFVGIGAWAVQVGTLDLRRDLNGMRDERARR
jgi:hypothetical protein